MQTDPFALTSYQYDLPQELIAQHPCMPRDQSRLLVIDRQKQTMDEIKFRDFVDFLSDGDQLIFNDTKVMPARLMGQRQGGGKAEILLLKRLSAQTWEVMAKPGKKLINGAWVEFGADFKCQIIETTLQGTKIVEFFWQGGFEEVLMRYGQMPLPPYIQRAEKLSVDESSYQTVYAAHLGAVAAPTAGLHFTEEMLEALNNRGVKQTHVTLHTGMGTFKPVQTDDIRNHPMHSEEFIISAQAALELNQHSLQARQICVGTTSCRALESAANADGSIVPGVYETDIFIYPGYQFKFVRAMITNFHLPGSTLLMLVCAFAGHDLIMEAYAKAVKDRFRFYSYGDAMLII
jgi:S-adenosylmethionine:tRNA ribosyltransferase-isomerase